MIVYDTRDILDRARQIGNLENTSFITDDEELTLLNDCWVELYEKAIEAGEPQFIKRAVNTIPTDCYRIHRVYDQYRQYPLDYYLQDNQLYYNNRPLTNYTLEYYPKPQTLFVKQLVRDSPYEQSITAADDTLYMIDGGDYFDFRDIYDSSISLTIPAVEYDDVALFDNCMLIVKNGITSLYVVGDNVIESQIDKPCIVEGKYYQYKTEEKQIVDEYGNIYMDQIELPEGDYYYTDGKLEHIYAFSDGYYTYNGGERIELTNRKLKMAWFNNHPYCIIDTHKLVRCEEERLYVMDTEYQPVMIVSDRKLISKRPVSSKYHLEGLQESVLLNSPSNLFYQALEYLIAVKLTNKTGQASELLANGYSDYLTQYLSSIQPSESLTIQNEYRGSEWMRNI